MKQRRREPRLWIRTLIMIGVFMLSYGYAAVAQEIVVKDNCNLYCMDYLGLHLAYFSGVKDKTVTEVVIPSEVEKDGVIYTVYAASLADLNESDIETITISEGVSIISSVYNIPKLKTLNIPASVISFSESFTDGYPGLTALPSLTNVNVAEGNAYYASADGVLFSKDKKRLLYYPQGRTNLTYQVPDGVTEVGRAFCSNTVLESITFPKSTTLLYNDMLFGASVNPKINLLAEQVVQVVEMREEYEEESSSGSDGGEGSGSSSEAEPTLDDLLSMYTTPTRPVISTSTTIDFMTGVYDFDKDEYAPVVAYVPGSMVKSYILDDVWSGYADKGQLMTIAGTEERFNHIVIKDALSDVPLLNLRVPVTESVSTDALALDDTNWGNGIRISEPFSALDVSYTRNFTSTDWTTLYLPFAMSVNDLQKDFDIARAMSFSDNTLYVQQRETFNSDSIAAYTPILVKPKTAGEKTITAKKVSFAAVDADEQVIPYAHAALIGTLSNIGSDGIKMFTAYIHDDATGKNIPVSDCTVKDYQLAADVNAGTTFSYSYDKASYKATLTSIYEPSSKVVIPAFVTGTDGKEYVVSGIIKNYTIIRGEGLNELTVPGTIKALNSYICFDYTSLHKVTFYHGVESLGEILIRCDSVAVLNLPATLKTVITDRSPVFGSLKGLESITIPEHADSFKVVNGVLYNAAMTELYCYPAKKDDVTFTIPDGVEYIHYAFSESETLRHIVCPASVTRYNYDLTLPNDSATITFKAMQVVESDNGIQNLAGYDGKNIIYIPGSMKTAYHAHNTYQSVPLANLRSIPGTETNITYDVISKYDESEQTVPTVQGTAFGDDNPVIESLTIDESDYQYGIKVDGTALAKSLSYVRTYDDTNWQTLFVPFDIPVAQLPEGLEVARVTGMENAITAEGERMAAGDTLKANYPYLIRSTATGKHTITLTNVYIKDLDCYPEFEGGDIEALYYHNDPDFPYGIYAYGSFWYQNNCMVEGSYLRKEWSNAVPFRWACRENYDNDPILVYIIGDADYALNKALGQLQYKYNELTYIYNNVKDSEKCEPAAKTDAVAKLAAMETLLANEAVTAEDINDVLSGYEDLYDRLTSEYIPDLGDTKEWIVDESQVKIKNNMARKSYYVTADDDNYFVRFNADMYENEDQIVRNFTFSIDGVKQSIKRYTNNQVYEIPKGKHTIKFQYDTPSNYSAAYSYCKVTNISFMTKADFKQAIIDEFDNCLDTYKLSCGPDEKAVMTALRAKAAACALNIDTLDYYMAKMEDSKELDHMERIYITLDTDGEPGSLCDKMYDYDIGTWKYDFNPREDVYKLTVKGSLNNNDIQYISNNFKKLRAIDLQNTTGLTDVPEGFLAKNGFLTIVLLPEGVKTIGDNAFFDTKIKYINLPEGLESIGDNAFWNPNRKIDDDPIKSDLSGKTLPSTLKHIGDMAFYEAWDDSTLVLPDALQSIGMRAFYHNHATNLVIPANVKLGFESFALSQKLKALTFKDGFDFHSSSQRAFADCCYEHRIDIVFPASVTTIPFEAFNNANLGHVALPRKMKSIGDRAFNATALLSIDMPDELDEIGIQAFANYDKYDNTVVPEPLLFKGYGCSQFETIKLPETLTSLKTGLFERCVKLKNVNIPSKVKEIPYNTFWLCESLDSITLPAGVKSIGDMAFAATKSLKDIVLPDSVVTIGAEAFCRSGIKEMTLSDRLETIGIYAFGRADSLKTVTSRALVPPIVDDYNGTTFPLHSDIKVRVPQWTYNDYAQNAYWSDFDLEGYCYEPDVINVSRDITFNVSETSPGYRPELHMLADTKGKYAALTNISDATLPLSKFTYTNNIWALANYNFNDYNNIATNVLINNTGKMRADEVVATYKLWPGYWYFVSVPFNTKLADITDENGNHPVMACYTYSGEKRANGEPESWVRIKDDAMLESGVGYIINTRNAWQLTLKSIDDTHKNDIFRNTEKVIPLSTYSNSKTKSFNHNWNFIANPYQAFYDVENIGTNSPVVIYDYYYNTYKTISHADGDQHVLFPGEAFFIQAAGRNDRVVFSPDHRLSTRTKEDSGVTPAKHYITGRTDALSPNRSIINLTITNDTDSMMDATRVVINEDANAEYEIGIDAAKLFAPDTQTAQLFSYANGALYSLNERPVKDGVVNLGITFAKAGDYTFSLPECINLTDYSVYLEDLDEGKMVKMDDSSHYTFTADEGQCIGRFFLHITNASDASGIASVRTTDAETKKMYDLAGRMIKESTIAHGVIIENNKKVLKK